MDDALPQHYQVAKNTLSRALSFSIYSPQGLLDLKLRKRKNTNRIA